MLPDRFVQPWIRTELVLDGRAVTGAGTVVWIQGPTLFVDVRAPGGPGNDTAFAGTVAWGAGALTWRHRVDRSDEDREDTANVHFSGADLIEVGEKLFGADTYLERWHPMDGGGAVDEHAEPGFIAVRHGDHAAAIVDRRATGGGFGACYWRRRDGAWVEEIVIGDATLLAKPGDGLFPSEVPEPQPLVDLVRDAIVLGRFAPGERLTEERLAAEFGVSRSPVREALRALATEGFVHTGHYAGTFVAELGVDEVEDLLELRRAIESLAARRAAERRNDAHIRDMTATIADARASLAAGRFDDLVELNSRFHAVLAAASGNPSLHRLLDQLRAKIAWVYGADVRGRAAASWQEHDAMLEAVAAGDGDRAAACALDHVANATAAYRGR